MKNKKTEISFNLLARIAGVLYFIVILGGIFSEVFVRQELIAFGDPISTANNILKNESLFRWGFAIQLIYLVCNIPLVLIFHELFKWTNKLLALLFLLLFLTANTIEIANMINHFLPLDLLQIGTNLEGLKGDTSSALAYMSLATHSIGFSISLVFFGCYCILIGYLIIRSTLLPRLLGLLMMIAGFCYMFDSFSLFLAPEFAKNLYPHILLPCLIAEASLASWLVFKGVKTSSEKDFYKG